MVRRAGQSQRHVFTHSRRPGPMLHPRPAVSCLYCGKRSALRLGFLCPARMGGEALAGDESRPRAAGGAGMKYAAVIEYSKDKAMVEENRPAHRRYLTELLQKGQLFATGPFTDDYGA